MTCAGQCWRKRVKAESVAIDSCGPLYFAVNNSCAILITGTDTAIGQTHVAGIIARL